MSVGAFARHARHIDQILANATASMACLAISPTLPLR